MISCAKSGANYKVHNPLSCFIFCFVLLFFIGFLWLKLCNCSSCSEIIFLQLCWIDLFLWLLTKDSALFFEIMFHRWCPSQAHCPGTLNRRQCFDSLEHRIITEPASWCCNWRAWKELVADNWWWLESQNWGWWKVGGNCCNRGWGSWDPEYDL